MSKKSNYEVLGDVGAGVAGCFHKNCYQKILRQKSYTVNIKWHISVFSMGKRISSKNKQIACSSTYLPSIDSRGSPCMQFQVCRNQGGQGAIVPPTIFSSWKKSKTKWASIIHHWTPKLYYLPSLLNLCSASNTSKRTFMQPSCTLDCFLLKKKFSLRPASEKGCVTLKGNSCAQYGFA